jgi:transcription antitermination factor NusG
MPKSEKINQQPVAWYAVYTKPRWEKKVFDLLTRKNIDAYCPLNKMRKKWSDRMRTVYEPLFKSYVFVRVTEAEKSAVRMTEGIINFVYWLGKPAVIKESEIENIRRFLKEHESQTIESIALKPGQRVTLQSGLLMDQEGEVLQVMHNQVLLQIDSLGYILVAKVAKADLLPSGKKL